jgi:hypothetical protein
MIHLIRTVWVSTLLVALAAGAGCAAVPAGQRGNRDLHATARIAGDAPRMLVSGPALLMHVDFDGGNDLALYAVVRRDGTEADCAADAVGERRRLRPGLPNLVNVVVPANQEICVAPMSNRRAASVRWHARRLDGRPAGDDKALAFDGLGQ